MPISRPCGVEQRPARIAGIDRGVGLQAVGVFQQRAGGELVAMHAGNDAVGDGGLQVGGQQERIAHGEDPVAGADLVAVAHFGAGEIVAAEELDQGHVAGGIEPDQHGVVDLAVGHAALHGRAAGLDDVEIGQGVAVGRDDHARAAALAVRLENRQHRRLGLLDHRDPLGLGIEHGLIRFGSQASKHVPRTHTPIIMQRNVRESTAFADVLRPREDISISTAVSFRDSRVAQIEVIAEARLVAEIDQNAQLPHAGQIEIDRLGRIGSGDGQHPTARCCRRESPNARCPAAAPSRRCRPRP